MRPDAADRARSLGPQAALREGHGEAAARHVLGGGEQAALGRLADERLDPPLAVEVERRRAVLGGEARERGIRAPGETRRRLPDEQDPVAGVPASPGGRASRRPRAARRRRSRASGAIAPPGRLVVERDVAAGDRQPERAARVGEAADALGRAARTPRAGSGPRSSGSSSRRAAAPR